MPEGGKDLDTLLEEVSDLANQAASALGGEAAGPAEAAGTQASPVSPAPSAPAAAPERPRKRVEDPTRILRLEVPVIVELARRTMPMAEILSLSSGSIIEFEKPADSELDLMINNKRVGQGLAVKVGENFGLRVRSVGSVRERIRALGK